MRLQRLYVKCILPHLLIYGMQEVSGSIPLGSTNKIRKSVAPRFGAVEARAATLQVER